MHQQVGARAVFDDVLVVARVAGEHRGAAAIFDAVAVARLDDVAVVDLEGDDLDAALLVDDAVVVELLDLGAMPCGRQLLVGDADLDVVRRRPCSRLDMRVFAPTGPITRNGAVRARIVRLQPAGEPQVRNADV